MRALAASLAPRQIHDAVAGPFQAAQVLRGSGTQMGVERAPVEAPRKRVKAVVAQLRFGQAPQLAAVDGAETPAADLAARLEAPVQLHQIAPRRQRFSLQQSAENNPVTLEQSLCDLFCSGVFPV